ncbi:sigma-70 family RNA polymerase sigma factor [Luteipulveratus sp. YIM 133132]|uniref:RNA polymerase sigma factor n=1 Tax=Luteipulveratus flavus TaxID=3031728 RepID=UPI0023AF610A|nr:sigma-70 family RNA polymerase sigma factor [Luteipulveratus sp. YIM 133132]MDE9365749.1 sigma-70 family RNA polymerase sigma factor [Luteipulveratus sp. YIM 133132]
MSIDQTSTAPTGESVWTQAADCFRRWSSGDAEALDGMVRALSPVLWQVVRAYGLDRDRAEDVVQSTWLALVRRRDSINDAQAVGSWLTTTARREAWRVSRLEGRAEPVSDEVIELKVPERRSAEAEAIAHDEGERLWAGVSQLSDRCQRLLRVIAFSDRPDYSGLALELGMPVGSIGPTRGRCLDKLRTLLADQNDRGPR